MDVKLNINLNSNLMNLSKSGSAVAGGANLKSVNLQSGDRGDILRGASDSLSGANEAESSADILKNS